MQRHTCLLDSNLRDDIPLKVLVISCHSIIDKKLSLENMIESTQADITLGTESWLKSHHLSAAVSPKNFKAYRKYKIPRLEVVCLFWFLRNEQ